MDRIAPTVDNSRFDIYHYEDLDAAYVKFLMCSPDSPTDFKRLISAAHNFIGRAVRTGSRIRRSTVSEECPLNRLLQ